MAEWAVAAENLVKKFVNRAGDNKAVIEGKPARRFFQRAPKTWFTAVNGVSLQIAKGEIFGLLGPMGPVKPPPSACCAPCSSPPAAPPGQRFRYHQTTQQVRQSLGTMLAGERSIYWKLTARENLEYFAALYHIPPAGGQKTHQRTAGAAWS